MSSRVSGEVISLVFDPKKLRPACEDVQIAYGCSSYHVHMFDPATWLAEANDDMVVISEPLVWWRHIAEAVNRRKCYDN